MKEVIAVDFYNLAITGGVCMTIRAKSGDSEHTPCVIIHNRIVDKTSALITDQNQKVRKDTPLVVEVRNGRAENGNSKCL